MDADRWVIACLAVFLGNFGLSAAVPNYFTRVWQTDDGLPQNAVSAIVQTSDGYLWIGTYSGLARFDGVRFVIFNNNNTPEMYSSRVTSLFEDAAKNLWIGFETGGLMRYENGHFRTAELPAAWGGRKIISIGADGADDIWALGIDGALVRVRDGLILQSETEGTSEVGYLVKDRLGSVWVFWNGQASRLEGERRTPTPFSGETGYVQAICASRDGGLWVVADGRVRKWREGAWVQDLGPSPWGPDTTPSAFIETRSGALAAGVVDQGLNLILLEDGKVLYFNRTNGLPSDWVRTLREDREGDLWMGTGKGLVVLHAGKVATVNPPDRWQGRAILSVSVDGEGSIWAGTEGAGLYRLKRGEWSHFGTTEGLANLFVWSVSGDPLGRMWAGTWGAGLFMQQGNRFGLAPGFEKLTVPMLALLHVGKEEIWVGTETGLLHGNAGKVEVFGRNRGLIFPDVRAVAQDDQGSIWFGMLGGGLGRLKDGNIQQFRKVNGLSSDFVQCLHLDQDGSLWIGTFGGGLNRLKEGRFSTINGRQGLPNDTICDIEDDGHGNFWFSSHGGIFGVRKELLNQCADGLTNSLTCVTYDKGDGLPTLECSGGFQPAGCQTPDGRLWFPTSEGLVVLDPTEQNINHMPPPVVMEDLLIDGQPVADGVTGAGPLRIPPGRNRFDFRYTGLSLVSPEKVRFKYKVEGLESDWVDAGPKRTANYSFIPPGDYTFHVIACNNDGIWNESGAALSFTVLPHFWQSWWFRGLSGGVAAVGIGSVVASATRRRMRWKLERLERQQAVERERTRIAKDIHDDLGASLTRITLLSQSARAEVDHPGVAATSLDRIYGIARELTRAMDEIVWAVNPQHDTLDSLVSYLARFAQDFLGSANVSCRLDVSAQLPAWPLTAEVRHNLFLAFKEALHNAVKHASATEVRISLAIHPPTFTLALEDNGRGFAPDATPSPDRFAYGNGLNNMRRRLAEISGQFEIQSAPGGGTRVRFIVPVPRQGPG